MNNRDYLKHTNAPHTFTHAAVGDPVSWINALGDIRQTFITAIEPLDKFPIKIKNPINSTTLEFTRTGFERGRIKYPKLFNGFLKPTYSFITVMPKDRLSSIVWTEDDIVVGREFSIVLPNDSVIVDTITKVVDKHTFRGSDSIVEIQGVVGTLRFTNGILAFPGRLEIV